MQHSNLTPRETKPRVKRKRFGARTIMGILREQGIPDSEARQRISSDPTLRAEIEQLSRRLD